MQESLKQKLANYKTPPAARELINSTRIVLLVGIAGAGKNTILSELLKKPEYRFIVSHTTRASRTNRGTPEKDGVNYHFINLEQAEKMLERNEFVEAKNVHGKVYGTSIEEIDSIRKADKIAITDLDVQGVAEYMAVSKSVVPVFLLPPDFVTWQSRLMSRYEGSSPDPEDLTHRMKSAKMELQEALDKDYFEFVINDDLSRAVTAVDEITHGSLSPAKNEQARKLAQELLDKLG